MNFVIKKGEFNAFNNGSKRILSEKEVIGLFSEQLFKDLDCRFRGNRQKLCDMLNLIDQDPKKASEKLKQHFEGVKGIEDTVEMIQMRISNITFS